MKNLYVCAGLLLALICVNQIWADENDILVESDVAVQATEVNEERTQSSQDEAKGFTIGVGIDSDELSDQESIDRVTKLVREIAGDDAAQEVLLELEGMNEEQKAEVADAVRKGLRFDSDDIPNWAGAVAIIAVVLLFGSPIIILGAVFIYLARKRRQKMHIIQVYLDAGKDVPSELLRDFDSSGGSFRSGLTLTAVGLGIVAAFNTANEPSVGALGLIPLFIGIAKLVYWLFEERKLNKS